MKDAIKESYDLLTKLHFHNKRSVGFKFSSIKRDTELLINIAERELEGKDELLKKIKDFYNNLEDD